MLFPEYRLRIQTIISLCGFLFLFGCADDHKVEKVAEWACEWNLAGEFPSLDHIPSSAGKAELVRKKDLAFAADPKSAALFVELGKSFPDELKPAATALAIARSEVVKCAVTDVQIDPLKTKATAKLNMTVPELADEYAAVEKIASLESAEQQVAAAGQALAAAKPVNETHELQFVKEGDTWKLDLDLPQASAQRREYLDLKHRFEEAVKNGNDAQAKKLLAQAQAVAPSKKAANALATYAEDLEIQLRINAEVAQANDAKRNNNFKDALKFAQKALEIRPSDADLQKLVAELKEASEQVIAGGWRKVSDNPLVIELIDTPTKTTIDKGRSTLRVTCFQADGSVDIAIKPSKDLGEGLQEIKAKVGLGQTEFETVTMSVQKGMVGFKKGKEWLGKIAKTDRLAVRIPASVSRSTVFETNGGSSMKRIVDSACSN